MLEEGGLGCVLEGVSWGVCWKGVGWGVWIISRSKRKIHNGLSGAKLQTCHCAEVAIGVFNDSLTVGGNGHFQ